MSAEQMHDTAEKVNDLAVLLRRHFGPLWNGEPSMLFRWDGTVRVSVGGNSVELTRAQAEEIANAHR